MQDLSNTLYVMNVSVSMLFQVSFFCVLFSVLLLFSFKFVHIHCVCSLECVAVWFLSLFLSPLLQLDEPRGKLLLKIVFSTF